MSCYTSYSYDLRDKFKQAMYHHSYGWTYQLGWASVGKALIGSLISIIGLFKLPGDVVNPATEISYSKDKIWKVNCHVMLGQMSLWFLWNSLLITWNYNTVKNNLACRWRIVESAKIFWTYVKHFSNPPPLRNTESLLIYETLQQSYCQLLFKIFLWKNL